MDDATKAQLDEIAATVYGPQTPVAMTPAPPQAIPGVGPDAQTVVNSAGGKQSFTPFDMRRMPHLALLAISAVVCKGHWKYDDINNPDDRNWKSIPRHDNENHAAVHLSLHIAGDQSDFHLPHSACRELFALEQWLMEHPEVVAGLAAEARRAYDDRMQKEQAGT